MEPLEYKSVAIIGFGALGCMFADKIESAKPGSVVFVAGEDRVERYLREGVYCNGIKKEFSFESPKEALEPADVVIIAVKSSGLEDAINLASLKTGKGTVVVSLMNGVSSEAKINKQLGDVCVMCVAGGMDATKLGNKLEYRTSGTLQLGELGGAPTLRLLALEAFFSSSGINCVIRSDIVYAMYSKLMFNCGVNPSSMVNEATYADMKKAGKAREMMLEAMEEARSVAIAEGIPISRGEVEYWLGVLESLDGKGRTSMAQDRIMKRKSENDLFSGAILELGKKHGIPTPTSAMLYNKIIEIEAGY